MVPIFNTSQEYPRMHGWWTFGDSSPNPAQNELSPGQAKFLRILSQMAKMNLKVKVNDLDFQ